MAADHRPGTGMGWRFALGGSLLRSNSLAWSRFAARASMARRRRKSRAASEGGGNLGDQSMDGEKIVLENLFVDRTWRLYENKKGGGVIFAVKFLWDQPPEGMRRANEVKVKYDGVTQELQVGEAIVRRASSKIDIDPAGGNAVIDVQIIPVK